MFYIVYQDLSWFGNCDHKLYCELGKNGSHFLQNKEVIAGCTFPILAQFILEVI
jgi:hypothetical protein